MALTVSQKQDLANRLVNAQQTGNFGSFNELVRQLALTQADLLSNFPAINQAGIDEQIQRGAVVPTVAPGQITSITAAQKNELANRLASAQATGNYRPFNELVSQLRLTQSDLLYNLPNINQAGLDQQIARGAIVPFKAGPQTTFTTGQVSSAIRDALNAGFTVEQARMGAMTNFGLSSEAFDKALQSVQGSTYNTTFNDARVAQAIRDSLAQGFSLDQARQGAMANYGVGQAQFDRAAAMVSGAAPQTRGSAPLYQFPSLLADRQNAPIGAQRYLAQAPTSLLFDVPKVEGGQFTFTPGAFDYQAIREQQAGASQVDQAYLDQNQIQPGSAEYIRLTGKTTPQSSTTGTTSTTGSTTGANSSTTKVGTTTGTTTTGNTSTTATTGLLSTKPTYSNEQVAQAIIDSLRQGYTLDQIQGGALRNFGVVADQFNQATALLPGLGYTIGKGFTK